MVYRPYDDDYDAPDEMPDTIDLKKVITRIFRKWYWFPAGMFLAVLLAWAYNRYADPVYQVNSLLLIDKAASGRGTPLSIGSGISGYAFEGFAVMSDGREYLTNQMAILHSRPLIEKTIAGLDFDVTSYARGRVNEFETYLDFPFSVIWDKHHPQVIGIPFEITVTSDGTCQIKATAENAAVYSYDANRITGNISGFKVDKKAMPGENIEESHYSFSLLPKENFPPKEGASYRIQFNTPDDIIDSYQKKLTVSLYERESSTLILSVRDRNVDKGIAFLNKLTETYLADNLNKKNEIANRTIDFIEKQLKAVSDSLDLSGSKKQAFQSSKRLINISYQTEQLLQQAKELDNQRRTIEAAERYYQYLNNYMQSEQEPDNIIAPSSMGVEDPLLSALILQYNRLLVEKSSLINVRNTEYFKLRQISAQLESIRKSLIENTSSMMERSKLALSDVEDQNGQLETRLRQLPATERDYVNIERRYNLDAETYTFLLQKLSEAQIAKASNIPDSQILEEARKGIPVEPRKSRNYLFALILGLAGPGGILFISSLVSKKIRSIDDIEAISGLAVIGRIWQGNNPEKPYLPLLDNPDSDLAEPFRGLRNKINLMTGEADHPVTVISSAMTGEGKTCMAINLAVSYALIHEKTVLLDLDLRHAGVACAMGVENSPGVADYIRGNAGIREIIRSTPNPSLDVITAGVALYGAGELLMDKSVAGLIASLKETYDRVIIDTPAAGWVSDFFQISALADVLLFVIRHNFTEKKKLGNAIAEIMLHRLKRIALVVNGVDMKDASGDYDAGNSRHVEPLG
jgi:tyrosine-protein kinase Etk/Wzc